jgi:hypothetical protein
VTVSVVIGAATPQFGLTSVLGGQLGAADLALHHARAQRLPYSLYQPGMTLPTTWTDHSVLVPDLRSWPPVAQLDIQVFRRLVDDHMSSDGAHTDDFEQLTTLVDVVDPARPDFGTTVADVVGQCLTHGVLRLHPPVTAVMIEPTTRGEYRDGGFRVLVDVEGFVTLASSQLGPLQFAALGPHTAEHLLTAVVETVQAVYDAYRLASGGRAAQR